jgi:hypothetical protein
VRQIQESSGGNETQRSNGTHGTNWAASISSRRNPFQRLTGLNLGLRDFGSLIIWKSRLRRRVARGFILEFLARIHKRAFGERPRRQGGQSHQQQEVADRESHGASSRYLSGVVFADQAFLYVGILAAVFIFLPIIFLSLPAADGKVAV